MLRSVFVVASLAGFLAGCGATTTPGYIGATYIVDGKGQRTVLFGFDANRRGQIARLTSSGELIDSCSEPPPDAATTLAQKVTGEATGAVTTAAAATGEGKVAGSYEASQAVIELGKRTSETLFLREILFRRCEARMNARNVADTDARPADGKGSELKPLTADEVKGKIEADDAFFTQVITTYGQLSATKERAERAALMRELQAKLPADYLKDSEMLKRLGEAVDDPSKVAAVYQRANELAKAAEDKKKAEAEAAAKTKCETDDAAKKKTCSDACTGAADAIKTCKEKCESDAKTRVEQCVKEAVK